PHYGIGELTAVTILAELGDCERFSSSRDAVRYAGMDITVYEPDRRRSPGPLSRQGPPALRWRCMRPPRSRGAELTRPRVLHPGRGALGLKPCVPVGRAQAFEAQLPHAVRARRGGAHTRSVSFPVRAKRSP